MIPIRIVVIQDYGFQRVYAFTIQTLSKLRRNVPHEGVEPRGAIRGGYMQVMFAILNLRIVDRHYGKMK